MANNHSTCVRERAQSHPVARYSVSFGLSGCYLPDSHGGIYEVTRRKDLAGIIRDELQTYDLPAGLFRDAHVRRLWRFITRNGSSVAHFSLYHGDHVLAFSGLTQAEYEQAAEGV
jgi:hypothetical protein